jgi:hypothetical protein
MKRLLFIQLILVVFFVNPASSQEADTDSTQAIVDTLNNDFGLFTNEDILHLALRFDLKEYTRKKPKEEYLKAILTYYISDRDSINKEIRLRSRGEFRNGYCSFPPLYLNFKKSEFEKEDIKKIEKMKLVTHCQSGNENYLLKEYLIYKLYNVLTDNSFRVRLVKIDYVSTPSKRKTIHSYGFFIEPLDILAERLKTYPTDSPALTQKNIIPEMMDRVAIFNYMIGNTDWSVPGQHNCKVLSSNSTDHPDLGMIIPYDFDYSGFVNAHYAIPAEGLGISNVTQRLYLGACRNDEELLPVLKEFSDKKSEVYRTINEFPLLNEKIRNGLINYLNEFYTSLEKGNILFNIHNQCKDF